jgi:hypothetical protein
VVLEARGLLQDFKTLFLTWFLVQNRNVSLGSAKSRIFANKIRQFTKN